MKTRLHNLFFSGSRLAALCYGAFFAASLLGCLASFASDRALRASGQLAEQTLSVTDFALINLDLISIAPADGALASTTDDPRMVLTDCPTRVSRVDMQVTFFNMDPGEFTLFYKPREGMEDFDANYRVWGELQPDGSYAFAIPAGKTYGLRIDPGMYAGLQLQVTAITLNARQSALSFFTPSRQWLLAFAVVPALAASAIRYFSACAEAFAARRGRNKLEGK